MLIDIFKNRPTHRKSVQYKATLAITGSFKDSYRDKLYLERTAKTIVFTQNLFKRDKDDIRFKPTAQAHVKKRS